MSSEWRAIITWAVGPVNGGCGRHAAATQLALDGIRASERFPQYVQQIRQDSPLTKHVV